MKKVTLLFLLFGSLGTIAQAADSAPDTVRCFVATGELGRALEKKVDADFTVKVGESKEIALGAAPVKYLNNFAYHFEKAGSFGFSTNLIAKHRELKAQCENATGDDESCRQDLAKLESEIQDIESKSTHIEEFVGIGWASQKSKSSILRQLGISEYGREASILPDKEMVLYHGVREATAGSNVVYVYDRTHFQAIPGASVTLEIGINSFNTDKTVTCFVPQSKAESSK